MRFLLAFLLATACSLLADTPWLTYTPSLNGENDFTGYTGCQITTGAAPVIVTQMGFQASYPDYTVTGYGTGSLTVIIQDASHAPVAGATATISVAGIPWGTNLWSTLGTPVTLAPSTVYFLVLAVVSGDKNMWRGQFATPAPTATAIATVNAVTFNTGSGYFAGPAGDCWGGVNFQYSGGASTVKRRVIQ